MPIAKAKIVVYLDKSRKTIKRALRKEPFLCLIGASIVFSFGILIFGLNFTLKSLGDFSLLASAVESGQNLFVQSFNNFVKESPSMSFIQKNSLISISPTSSIDGQTLGSMIGAIENGEEREQRKDILEYIIEPGDSLSSLAEKFNISLSTILIANNLNSKSIIKPGNKLIILPVNGILYYIKQGDTLSDIAKTYKGETEEIITVNGLSSEGDIFIGDILIIPNGKIPASKPSVYPADIPIGSSYFIYPVATVHITQGLHWYNAIDFGAKCGEPIYAAAAGVIQKIGYGWNGGAGNYVRIIHPNGVVTMYGHVQTILVVQGQYVSQGDIIALVGGKPGMAGAGKSTGCHVHFDVFGARNPFAK